MTYTPLDVDSLSYPGLVLRRATLLSVMGNGSALGARSGLRPGDGGLTVTLAGSTINVSAGAAFIYQPSQGVYRAVMPSSASPGSLTAAHATLTRIDLVYIRVWDNSVDSSGLNQGDVVYLAGTPSGSPVAPTPAGTQIYMPLATITVPPVGGGSASVSTTVRPLTVAPGGILPSQTTTPSSPYAGQAWHDGTDLKIWNGASVDTYQKVVTAAWTTPSVGTGYTQGDTTTNGNLNGPIRYRKVTRQGTDFMEWDGGATRASGAQVLNILSAALAVGFRPVARASFVVPRNSVGINSGEANIVHSVKLDFNQDGTVAMVAATAGTSECTWFSLRGISYPLA